MALEAPLPPDVQPLATLLQLARRARDAVDEAELDFVIVNESFALASYRQAALWLEGGGVRTLSGVVSADVNAPYVQWLDQVFSHLARDPARQRPMILADAGLPPSLAAEWDEWLPAHGLWLPLPAVGNGFGGGALLLARDTEWTEPEVALLAEWTATWTRSRALIASPSPFSAIWRLVTGRGLAGRGARAAPGSGGRLRGLLRSRRLWSAAILTGVLLTPVRLTVLAPAELVPLNPAVIRAPLDGVVDRVLVTPNQRVDAGASLFEFDRANLRNRLLVSERALGTAEAEYRQRAQQAVFDPASKSQLAVLQAQIAERATEVSYLSTLNDRGVVVSPRAGVVLFGDATEWVGRPVITGERVMMVADEHAVEIEAWLSPSDAIPLVGNAELTLYLNADPLAPLAARLRYVAHEAIERPDGRYAYRVRATLSDLAQQPRVGLKGTAKLHGDRVTLGYWMLRRPLASARAWLGV